MRQNVAKDVFENAGLLRGNRVIDRNVADAISPFAEVDYDTLTVKGWRQVAGAPRGEEPVGGPPVPVEPQAGGGGAARGAPARRPTTPPAAAAAGATPIPRKADGSIEVGKLEAGKSYVSESGAVRIWNGTSWQKAK
jgi:hypothetical protein